MKKLTLAVLLAGNLLYGSDFNIGISGNNGKIDGFTLSIGEYYKAPHQEIVVLERKIPRDELGVVYFLARKAHKDPAYISGLRARGISWWDITSRLGLNPRVIYAHNSHHKRHLYDREIVDTVNIRFLSDYHHITPHAVMERRRVGDRFDHIDRYYRENNRLSHQQHRDVRDNKHENRSNHKDARDNRREQDRFDHNRNDR